MKRAAPLLLLLACPAVSVRTTTPEPTHGRESAVELPPLEEPPAGPRTASVDEECVRVADLPVQEVADARIVHLGEGPGWAGRSITLCPESQPVRGIRFKVRQSGVTLDCNGVVFDGSEVEGKRPNVALDVSKTSPGIRDLTIRECSFVRYPRGIWLIGPDVASTDEAAALSGFRVEDTTVEESGDVGIYVGPHSRDFVIERVAVRRSYLTGIYLDAYARNITIRASRIEGNGFSRCSKGREGIAIDASSSHVIEGNVFDGNRYAGITIYKNCGETGTPRNQHANDNVIRGNLFRNHCHPEGAAVIVASRQGLDPVADDCLSDECEDSPAPGTQRYLDHARNNAIVDNRFERNVVGVLVRDDDNRVEGNEFRGGRWSDAQGAHQTQHHVYVGDAVREQIGRPISGVVVRGNRVARQQQSVGASLVIRNGANVDLERNRQGDECIDLPGNVCE